MDYELSDERWHSLEFHLKIWDYMVRRRPTDCWDCCMAVRNYVVDSMPIPRRDLSLLCCESVYRGHISCFHAIFVEAVDREMCLFNNMFQSLCTTLAASEGHLVMLRYIRMDMQFSWCSTATRVAAENGRLSCLEFLHRNGCPWMADTCQKAAGSGNLACLRYARENGCQWTKQAAEQAAAGNRLECLVYLHVNGCDWDIETCRVAAAHGSLQCLRYAVLSGCPVDASVTWAAAKGGHLIVLEFLRSRGCDWDARTCREAAAHGNFDFLVYAHSHGCRWDSSTTTEAAERGEVRCLEYAHTNGCPMDDGVMNAAARGGHVAVLEYLRRSAGIKWDERTAMIAAAEGNFKCLDHLHRHGCAWDRRVLIAAARNGHVRCLKYGLSHGLRVTRNTVNLVKMFARISDKTKKCYNYLLSVLLNTADDDAAVFSSATLSPSP